MLPPRCGAAARQFARCVRERACRICTGYRLHQPGRLGGLDARLQNRVPAILFPELEASLVAAAWRGRQHHRGHFRVADRAYRLQRIVEGVRQVRLVEQDQAVLVMRSETP